MGANWARTPWASRGAAFDPSTLRLLGSRAPRYPRGLLPQNEAPDRAYCESRVERGPYDKGSRRGLGVFPSV